MNPFATFYCRAVQLGVKVFQKLVRFRIPTVKGSLDEIPAILLERKLKHPILVSSRTVSKLNEFKSFMEKLKQEGILYDTYTAIRPDPTFESIEKLADFYINYNCDCIIAIGGGSVIDAAKAMGVLVTNSTRSLAHFKGVLKIHKDLPFFIAVPTTAGTGSEATVASVVINEKNNDKFAISDGHLIPSVAVLDDRLLYGLPQDIISVTGMDALTHAIEAYIGRATTKLTDEYAEKAMKLIQENLYEFYQNPYTVNPRKCMLKASFYAGVSFTRAYVGYVHALAHAIGGLYHKPHGYCVAILLPYVLEAYGIKAHKRLAQISDLLNLKEIEALPKEKAKAVIIWIREMNQKLNIPETFDGLIQEEDYVKLSKHAAKEANPLYPVPKVFSRLELEEILKIANGTK